MSNKVLTIYTHDCTRFSILKESVVGVMSRDGGRKAVIFTTGGPISVGHPYETADELCEKLMGGEDSE